MSLQIHQRLVLTTALLFLSMPPQLQAEYADSSPVGNWAGSFSVNGNGSSTYSLDIQVPPGTGGAQPHLQVSYDSHRGEGYLGIGWALNGTSAITRCNANYRVDGYKAGITYTDRDRFCIDGRKLIVVSGEYGADGSVYHTELETWSIFTAHGSCGQGPCSFTATNKNGSTLSLGATTGSSGSRVLAQGRTDGAVRTWAIDSTSDLNGNTVTVSYSNDSNSGEYYPTQIDYTANTAAGLDAKRSVTLSYQSRPDPVIRYVGGSLVTISKLLQKIETKVQGNLILSYSFQYEQSDATLRSRMTSAQKCDAKGVCITATGFDWYTAEEGFTPIASELPGPTYVILNQQLYTYGVLMDFNGDGMADYSQAAEFVIGNEPNTDLDIYLGQTDGSFVKAGYQLPGPVYRVTDSIVTQTGILLDINGDGILDFSQALRNEDAGTSDYTVYLGSDSGFSEQQDYQLPGQLFWQVNGVTLKSGILSDMNGDGIPDYSRATLLASSGETILSIYKGTGSGFEDTGKELPGALYLVESTQSLDWGILQDINGDGITDFSPAMVNSDAGTTDLKVYLGKTPDFEFNYSYDLPGQMLWMVNGTVLASGALVDINNDGIPDYSRASRLENSAEDLLDVYWGSGNGFTDSGFDLPGPLYSILNGRSYIQGMLTNWNDDSITRYSRATEWSDGSKDLALTLATSEGFTSAGFDLPSAMFLVTDLGTYAQATYQDINGDGRTDFVNGVCSLDAGSLQDCKLDISLGNGPYSDLLKTITNGFNGSTEISYLPLTEDLYTKGGEVDYPMRNIEGAIFAVNQYTNSSGQGDEYSFSYQYSGARSDLIGYGWIGFETITMIDDASGRESESRYDQDYPYYGNIVQSSVISGSGDLLTQSDLEYTNVSSAEYQDLGINQPLMSSERISHYTDNALDYTLGKDYSYNGYGDVDILSDLGDMSTSSDDVYNCAIFVNDSTSGYFGFLLQSKITSTLASCQEFAASTDPDSISWNSSTDLRWSKLGYDDRMNITSKANYDDSHSQFAASTFSIDNVGNTLTATGSTGHTTVFTYDSTYQAFLATKTSPTLTADWGSYTLLTQTSFDAGFGTLLSTIDPNGNETSQTLDGFGRIVASYGPNPQGSKTQLSANSWESDNGEYYLASHQRPDWDSDDQSDWYWDKRYLDGLGRNYRTERNGLKNNQPAAIVTNTIYDDQGRVYQQSAPHFDGDTPPYTSTEYDEYNRPILTTDPAGVQTKMEYAEGGWEITTTTAYGTSDARTSTETYNAQGVVVQKLQANELEVNYGYSLLQELLTRTTSPEARLLSNSYDSLGRLRSATDSNSGTQSWVFSADGLLTSHSLASGDSVSYQSYDALDRLRQYTQQYNGDSNTVAYTYDDPEHSNGLGNPTTVSNTQDPLGSWTYQYNYDAYHQAVSGSASISGNTYSYAADYDPLGRMTSATYPDSTVMSNVFRADRNLGTVSVQTPGNNATEYASYSDYTALSQLLAMNYAPVNYSVSQSYYPLGASYPQLQTKAAQQSGSTQWSKSYSWNSQYEITQITDGVSSNANVTVGYKDQPSNAQMGYMTSAEGEFGGMTYLYDQLGNVTNINSDSYSYTDGTDQLISGPAGTSYSYSADGTLQSKSASGTDYSYQFDSQNMLTQVESSADSPAAQAAYDQSGRLVYQQRIGEDKKTYWITQYFEVVDLGDGQYQHTVYIPGSDGIIAAITTDGIGNQYSLSASESGAGIHKAAAQLWSGYSIYGLAALAVLLSFSSLLYELFHRLIGRRKQQCPTAELNPSGRLLAHSLVALLLFQSVSPAAASLTPGENGAGIPTQGTVFFLQDHINSTTLVVDESSQNISARINYEPFGGIDDASSSGTDNFRPKFLSRQWDPTTALYHLQARYYDPGVGRFISPDPAGQYLNPYLYSNNSPYTYADPNGDFAFIAAMVIGAVVGAYFGAAATNHDLNPMHWNWHSGKTYAGLLGGAVIGAVGAAAGGIAVEAGVAIGAAGGAAAEAAGAVVGFAGQVMVGAGENAAYTALGGGNSEEILTSFVIGLATSALFTAAGEGISAVTSRFSRNAGNAMEEAGTVARREASQVESEAGAGGCCECGASFVAGTPILMADGSYKAIEAIMVGDQVAGRNLGLASNDAYPVLAVAQRNTRDLVRLEAKDGEHIITTAEHPFALTSGEWRPAGELQAGLELFSFDGTGVSLESVERYTSAEAVMVYNFQVGQVENYYVSPLRLLVHNQGIIRPFCKMLFRRGIAKEVWSESALRQRYSEEQFSALKEMLHQRNLRQNLLIESGLIKPKTRVEMPVSTASYKWVEMEWETQFPGVPLPSKNVRPVLAKLNPHFANQDVDEAISRILGGLTIEQGVPENQMPLNSHLNAILGGATGGMSRRVQPAEDILEFQYEFRDIVTDGWNLNTDELIKGAAALGDEQALAGLINEGVDPFVDDQEPLCLAAQYGHLPVVKLLCGIGADVQAQDNTPVRLAAEQGYLEIVRYLVDQGADVTAADNYAIGMATGNGHLQVVEYLLQQGADAFAKGGILPIIAARGGHLQILTLLASLGMDLNVDRGGALLAAAREGHLDTVKYLLQQGVSPAARGNEAIRLADKNQHREIVELLRSYA